MSRISVIIVLVVLLTLQSCFIPKKEFTSNGSVLLSPRGETITVTTEDQNKWKGEFVFLDEQFVYLFVEDTEGTQQELKSIPIESIVQFSVDSLVNRKWKTFVFGFQIAPAVVLGLTYAAYADDIGDGLRVAGITLIPGVLSLLAFSLSQPKRPELEGKIDYAMLKDLLKYARYPFTLTPEQKEKIFRIPVKYR